MPLVCAWCVELVCDDILAIGLRIFFFFLFLVINRVYVIYSLAYRTVLLLSCMHSLLSPGVCVAGGAEVPSALVLPGWLLFLLLPSFVRQLHVSLNNLPLLLCKPASLLFYQSQLYTDIFTSFYLRHACST